MKMKCLRPLIAAALVGAGVCTIVQAQHYRKKDADRAIRAEWVREKQINT